MIWPKKTAASNALSQSSKEPAEQLQPCPETWITGLGLNCVAGDQPFALLGAVGAGFCGARPDPVLCVPVPGKDGEQPVLSAPVSALEGIEHPAERMAILAEAALSQAAGTLPDGLTPEKVLVLTLLPDKTTARGSAPRVEALIEALRAAHPSLQQAKFRFVEATAGPVGLLLETCLDLAQGTWDAVIFGGVDSLVDAVSCTELALAERIMSVGSPDGLVPGEGATYLVLQRPAKDQPKANGRAKGIIRSAVQAPEPQSGKADSKKMSGQAAAIELALAQAELSAQDLGGVILPLGAETTGALEWYQVTQKIWPPKKPDSPEASEPPAGADNAPEEMLLHIALGELGAAAFALSTALACARFEFEHPAIRNILVCEAADQPLRGALVLQAATDVK